MTVRTSRQIVLNSQLLTCVSKDSKTSLTEIGGYKPVIAMKPLLKLAIEKRGRLVQIGIQGCQPESRKHDRHS